MGRSRIHIVLCLCLPALVAPFAVTRCKASCTSTITSFPYSEDFESSNGGWISGGTLDDWAWGAPAKPVISGAGSGSRCWMTGGLSASFYNLGEKSWVQSPCFDFTTVLHPYVSFKVFWETEKQYDGAALQYSTDQGTTWNTVGSASDPSNCLSQNWYNTPVVTNLSGLASVRDGWSGNVQATSGSCLGGSGSGTWVTASHCMNYLAGNPSVMFRFIFGAGTTCNNYDGFAFDLFSVGDAPGIVPQFTYACAGGRTIAFTGASNICAASWSWNFGDPASANNTATTQNASHTFSSDTTFLISLQAATPCGNGATSVNIVVFPYISISSTPVSCPGSADGSLTASVPNFSNPSYSWNVSPPVTTSSLSNISGGTYSVTVTGPGVCAATATATLVEPPPLAVSTTLLSPGCGSNGGSAQAIVTGGTLPYSYAWTPGGDTTATVTNYPPGSYSLAVTDAGGCQATGAAEIPEDCYNDIIFPSAFTPNGDGRNDLFYAAYVRIASYEIRIFNRWGEAVFISHDIAQPWDGTVKGHRAEPGVYTYYSSYSVDGIDYKEKHGRVTIYY